MSTIDTWWERGRRTFPRSPDVGSELRGIFDARVLCAGRPADWSRTGGLLHRRFDAGLRADGIPGAFR